MPKGGRYGYTTRVPAGKETAEVYHYSKIVSVAAKNRLWAIQ